MCELENRMVIGEYYDEDHYEEEEEVERGFENYDTGEFVHELDAFDYALHMVKTNKADKEEFVEWFFSNWLPIGGDK